jgi:hypothetical protein
MDTYILSPSIKRNKKWQIELPNGHIIHFGAKGYSDYTIHKDLERKEAYIKRHSKNENWDDLGTAGAWSRWILWNKPNLIESIEDMEELFDIRIEEHI